MSVQAPATSILLASYPAPSGHTIELRKNDHGYYTVSLWEDGSRLAIAVTREQALEHYQLAVRGGTTWSWS